MKNYNIVIDVKVPLYAGTPNSQNQLIGIKIPAGPLTVPSKYPWNVSASPKTERIHYPIHSKEDHSAIANGHTCMPRSAHAALQSYCLNPERLFCRIMNCFLYCLF